MLGRRREGGDPWVFLVIITIFSLCCWLVQPRFRAWGSGSRRRRGDSLGAQLWVIPSPDVCRPDPEKGRLVVHPGFRVKD